MYLRTFIIGCVVGAVVSGNVRFNFTIQSASNSNRRPASKPESSEIPGESPS